MHNHLFYETGDAVYPAQAGFARLYLASGVTTIRTAGTIDLDADLRLKAKIDAGRVPGPKIHVTGGYLNGGIGGPDPDGIARQVNEQADRGATSFKAYTSLRQSELAAAIRGAHARGFKVTGHLCAVGFRDAAAIGIDNLEHGLLIDTEFDPEKQADVCPDQGAFLSPLLQADMLTDGRIRGTIAALVQHGVAVTSTLAIFEAFTADESAFDSRLPDVLAPRLRKRYEVARRSWIDRDAPWPSAWRTLLTKEMQFERAFVAADGRLMAGVDLAMASTFLRFQNADVFQILDRHAYRAVFGKRYPLYSTTPQHTKVSVYFRYFDSLIELAASRGLPFRALDRILYVFDKEHNGKLT
jgi:hypothetical protein